MSIYFHLVLVYNKNESHLGFMPERNFYGWETLTPFETVSDHKNFTIHRVAPFTQRKNNYDLILPSRVNSCEAPVNCLCRAYTARPKDSHNRALTRCDLCRYRRRICRADREIRLEGCARAACEHRRLFFTVINQKGLWSCEIATFQ